jgi:hypothetical protein
MKIRIYAERSLVRKRVDVTLLQDEIDGYVLAGLPVVMERVEPFVEIAKPTFSLENDTAQMLMDELWRCGLRPTEGSGSAGSLAATERHLRDMQNVADAALAKVGVITKGLGK